MFCDPCGDVDAGECGYEILFASTAVVYEDKMMRRIRKAF